MASKGVLSKNYYIVPEAVADFGTQVYNMMAEADQAMAEASEIIADIASLTERVPSHIRCNELLEACASAQAEIKSVDFLSYGQKVDQGLQNLLDHNQYITEHFIKNMEAHTEKMRGLGEEFRRLTDSITYSGESLQPKEKKLLKVHNAENENTDGEEENPPQYSTDDLLRAGAAEVLEIDTEEVMTYVGYVNSGRNLLKNYMVNNGLGNNEEINDCIDCIIRNRQDLLVELYNADSERGDVGSVYGKIWDYYDLYRAQQGAYILAEFLEKNSENINGARKPEAIVPFLYFFYSDDLINLYEIEKVSEIETNCQELIEFYIDKENNINIRWGKIFYAYTWMQINSIESFTNNNLDNADFDAALEEFVYYYKEYEDVYLDIAEETGIPPQLIAVIHYRENSQDFKDGTFGIRLHDGHSLNEPYTYLNDNGETKTRTFNSFREAAIHAIQLKQYCINNFNLSSDTTDIVAMVCFTEAYNGMGYYEYYEPNKPNRISPYSFSGTDVYESGKYISDNNYEEGTIDQQVGTYRLLLAAVAGIYDAEDGKNYVNEICGGYIQ